MTTDDSAVTLTIDWNRPNMMAELGQYFLKAYEVAKRLHAQKRAEHAAQAPATADDVREAMCSIGPENLPEEHIDPQLYMSLFKLRQSLRQALDAELPDTDDPRVAAVCVTRDHIRAQTLGFINRLIYFLMIDSCVHPERRLNFDAIGVLGFDRNEVEIIEAIDQVLTMIALCNLHFPRDPVNAAVSLEVQQLRKAGECFYLVLQSVFPIASIGKCHQSFVLLMDKVGRDDFDHEARNYVRRIKAVNRDLANYRRNGGPAARPEFPVQQIKSLVEDVRQTAEQQQRCVDTIERMDKRQDNFISWLKESFNSFTMRFLPGKPTPTREEISSIVQLAQRYTALDRVREPHRSQLKAVIDYTQKHPILRKGMREDGALTLANAARAVWNANEKKWALLPDSYQTFEDLKSACYNLTKREDDPFFYAP